MSLTARSLCTRQYDETSTRGRPRALAALLLSLIRGGGCSECMERQGEGEIRAINGTGVIVMLQYEQIPYA